MNFSVPDMSCGHCTAAIEKAVKTADPAAAIQCDLANRKVRIDSSLSSDQVAAVIRAAGYDAELSAA
jgi:copper chaperone